MGAGDCDRGGIQRVAGTGGHGRMELESTTKICRAHRSLTTEENTEGRAAGSRFSVFSDMFENGNRRGQNINLSIDLRWGIFKSVGTSPNANLSSFYRLNHKL